MPTRREFDLKPGGILEYHLLAFLENILQGVKNQCKANPAIAIATTVTQFKTANSVDFTIDGQFFTKAATDNIALTALAVQPVSTFVKYLLSLDSSGVATTSKGNESFNSAEAKLPQLPEENCPIGYIEIETDSVTTFTSGTTDLNAAGITATYVNLSLINSGNHIVGLTNR